MIDEHIIIDFFLRQKQWLTMISNAFGGLEIFGIDILVAKDGREIVHDVNDVITLLGDTQEDDRKAIADLVQTHIIQSLVFIFKSLQK